MIGLGYSTYCLWQAHSGAAGCPVEIECSEDDMEADLLGIFFEELHNGDLSGCLHFLFVDILVTFQDILHLPLHLETSHAVGIVLITNDSLRMTEHEPLAQNDGA